MADTAVLQELLDRQHIADLLHTYCREVDLCHPQAITDLFTGDAVGDYGERLGGRMDGHDELLAFFTGLTLFTATSHHLSNIMIEFTGTDEARCQATLFAWHRFPGDVPDAFLYARYLDRVVRTPDGWRIAERVLHMAGQTGFDALTAGTGDGGWNMIDRSPDGVPAAAS